jgi:hypothetical protein
LEALAQLRCCAYNSVKNLPLAMEILSQRTLPTGSLIVQLLRLDRASFLELIHRHPTLVIELLQRQYGRLRAQRRQSAIAPAPFPFHGTEKEHYAA